MEINYNLTEDDFLNFNRFHIKNSKTVKRALDIQRVLYPIVFISLAFVVYKIWGISLLGSLIAFSILSVLWVIFYPKYFYYLIIRNTKKVIAEGENKNLLGRHHLVMTEEKIIESNSSGETRANWSGILDCKEDEKNFYLYNSAVSAIIIPKRDLKNEEEVRAYIKLKLAKV